jgi:hypothetical protein
LDPGLLMLSEIPLQICRVLGAQEGDLHGDNVRCYVPIELPLPSLLPFKRCYTIHSRLVRSREVGPRQETMIIRTDHTFLGARQKTDVLRLHYLASFL